MNKRLNKLVKANSVITDDMYKELVKEYYYKYYLKKDINIDNIRKIVDELKKIMNGIDNLLLEASSLIDMNDEALKNIEVLDYLEQNIQDIKESISYNDPYEVLLFRFKELEDYEENKEDIINDYYEDFKDTINNIEDYNKEKEKLK